MTDKLKQCPFCGGKGELIHDGLAFSFIRCKSCNARAPSFQVSFIYASDEKAIEAWNRRTNDAERNER